jgi:hypothetical protein
VVACSFFAMPRFYFHVCDSSGFVEDEEGRELADVETARSEAVKGARDIIAAEIQTGTLVLSTFIEVEDEHHTLLFTVAFEDVLHIDRTAPVKRHRKQ